jgi:hypothetical protein
VKKSISVITRLLRRWKCDSNLDIKGIRGEIDWRRRKAPHRRNTIWKDMKCVKKIDYQSTCSAYESRILLFGVPCSTLFARCGLRGSGEWVFCMKNGNIRASQHYAVPGFWKLDVFLWRSDPAAETLFSSLENISFLDETYGNNRRRLAWLTSFGKRIFKKNVMIWWNVYMRDEKVKI